MIAEINELDLEQSSGFEWAILEDIAKVYNGAGAEWMPDWQRDVLTDLLDPFEPAFLIHDWDYSYSDGTKKSFKLANRRMYRNMKKIVNAIYNPRTLVYFLPYLYWRFKAFAAYRACVRFGWDAWLEGNSKSHE